MIFLDETDFDLEYQKKMILYISEDINRMNIKDRLKFLNAIRDNVVNTLQKEKAIAKLRYEAINDLLKEN